MNLKVEPVPDMDKAFATALAPSPIVRKAAARTALVALSESSRVVLADCFRQCGIETVVVAENAAERLSKEKFLSLIHI